MSSAGRDDDDVDDDEPMGHCVMRTRLGACCPALLSGICTSHRRVGDEPPVTFTFGCVMSPVLLQAAGMRFDCILAWPLVVESVMSALSMWER